MEEARGSNPLSSTIENQPPTRRYAKSGVFLFGAGGRWWGRLASYRVSLAWLGVMRVASLPGRGGLYRIRTGFGGPRVLAGMLGTWGCARDQGPAMMSRSGC